MHPCVCVCVCEFRERELLVASSLAELSAFCPICSSHMVLGFRREASSLVFLSFLLWLFFYLFVLQASLFSPCCWPFLLYLTLFSQIHLLTHALLLQIHFYYHTRASSLLVLVTMAALSSAACRESECALLLHHSLPWILACPTLFLSPSFTLQYPQTHTQQFT